MFKPLSLFSLATLIAAGCAHPPTPAAPLQSTQRAVRAHDANRAKFFANAETQAKAPGAFAVGPDARPFLEAADRQARPERDALVAAIRADQRLLADVRRFGTLGWERQLPVLKRVMALECEVMGFEAPPLVIAEGKQRVAFFDFDPDRPGTGTVMLYPEALAEEANPYTALLLLIHETRHSKQFQLAFGARPAAPDAQILAAGYRAAFRAQQALKGKLSFCDFCTLHNEHEAFQTGNYVVGALTGFTVDTADMGCLSSQFDGQGRPKLDLVSLAREAGPERLLAAFNEREEPQFRLFFPNRP